MPKKLDHFLAVFVGDDSNYPPRMWDMLRYDRCYPASNQQAFEALGWVVLCQPHRDGVRGGFTIERWQSFGYRSLAWGQNAAGSGIPYSLMLEVEQLGIAKATAALTATDLATLKRIGGSATPLRTSAIAPTRRMVDRKATSESVFVLSRDGFIAAVADLEGHDTWRLTGKGRRALRGETIR